MKKMEITRLHYFTLNVFLIILSACTVLWLTGKSIPVNLFFNTEVKVTTIGHRGASGYAPEGTLSSYRMAVRMKVDYIEIDLQLTKDGEIVVMHDDTVNRTTNGKGTVKRMTLAEIKALDAGTWFNDKHPMYARDEYVNEKVPTLREVFEELGNTTGYLLETKSPMENPGLEDRVWALVEEFKLKDHVAIQSFSQESLKKFREWDDQVKLFQLIWYNRTAAISNERLAQIKVYADGIGVNFLRIDKNYVNKVKNAGLLIFPYTVNYQVNMDRALKWGVNGIHTDYPDRFKEVIEQFVEGD